MCPLADSHCGSRVTHCNAILSTGAWCVSAIAASHVLTKSLHVCAGRGCAPGAARVPQRGRGRALAHCAWQGVGVQLLPIRRHRVRPGLLWAVQVVQPPRGVRGLLNIFTNIAWPDMLRVLFASSFPLREPAVRTLSRALLMLDQISLRLTALFGGLCDKRASMW